MAANKLLDIVFRLLCNAWNFHIGRPEALRAGARGGAFAERGPDPAALDLQRAGVQQGGGADNRRAAARQEARAALPPKVPLRAGAGPPRHDEGQPVTHR